MDLLRHCSEDSDGTNPLPDDYREWTKDELIAEITALNEQVAKYVGIAAQRKEAVSSAVVQAGSLIDALERDLNDVGPWGNGYRQALTDVSEQLRLRFGGQ